MRECNNILVVVQTADDAKLLLPKVERIAQIEDAATVHIVRVAYEALVDHEFDDDETRKELKNFILESTEEALTKDIALLGSAIGRIESKTIWGRKNWEAIISAAESVDADLIVKAATKPADMRLLRTPDDWNLLRESEIPVLLCDERKWSDTPRLLASLDVFDEDHSALNIRILRQAHGFAEGIGGKLKVITAFPSLEFWSPKINTFLNYQSTMTEIEADATKRLNELLASNEIDDCPAQAFEGRAETVVAQQIEKGKIDLLIVGTTARKGLEGKLIGNTAEQLLSDTQVDVLTVP